MPPTNSFAHLRTFFADAAVPADSYSLGAPREGAWCVVHAGYGRDESWEVYLLSGGTKTHLTSVSNEEGACDVLLGELGFGYLDPGLRAEQPQ